MTGKALDPRQYSVDMDLCDFRVLLWDEWFGQYNGRYSVDEFLCRPNEALDFCRRFRQSNGLPVLPDDVILRTIMNCRRAKFSRKKRPIVQPPQMSDEELNAWLDGVLEGVARSVEDQRVTVLREPPLDSMAYTDNVG